MTLGGAGLGSKGQMQNKGLICHNKCKIRCFISILSLKKCFLLHNRTSFNLIFLKSNFLGRCILLHCSTPFFYSTPLGSDLAVTSWFWRCCQASIPIHPICTYLSTYQVELVSTPLTMVFCHSNPRADQDV